MADRIDDLAASFSRHLRAEGSSDRTAVLYRQAITQFCAWLARQEPPRDPVLTEISRSAIREFLAELAETKEAGTVKLRYRGLFRFCGWLVDEDELPEHPMKTLSPPKPKMKPVPILSDEDLAAIIKAVTGKDFQHRRDEVIVRLLLDCGIRVSELCGLSVEDVDLDQGMSIVRGKGNKVRPVYFGARTTAAVDRYLRTRSRERWAHLDAFLLSQRGPMTPDGVRERLNVIGAAAGIESLHPHRFRHTFAHDYLMNGGQERDLKRLAGWSSDVMLERYGASAADARAKAAAQRMKRGDRV